MDQVSEVRGAAYVHDRYRAEHGVFACLRRAMSGTDRIIRWTTAIAVLAVAAVTAVASYEHAHDLDRAHGELGWTAHMVPLTAHGLIYASSMVMLDSARRRAPVPALARWLLGDARGQRRSWSRARADRCGCGRVAGGRAGRLVRTPHDGYPQLAGARGRNVRWADPLKEQAAEVSAERLSADRISPWPPARVRPACRPRWYGRAR
jgi:hypothetical protein